jgi:membrane protease subunit (stomatin/prohibitin family)
LFIENMSVPEEVEKALDERSKLGILGDKTDVLLKVSAAEAMKEAAKNPAGGMAGAGIGLGAGMAMGKMFVDGMQSQGTQQQAQPTAQATKTCPSCNAQVSQKAKFCSECGAKLDVKKFCTNCGEEVSEGAKFCPSCGQKL